MKSRCVCNSKRRVAHRRIKICEDMKMIVSEKELCKSNEADSSSSARLGKAIIALLVIAAVLIAALAGAWDMFGTQLTAAMTIEKLDDNLWAMEYKGDR